MQIQFISALQSAGTGVFPEATDNTTYPANLCSFSGYVELAGFREDFGKTVGETVQTAAGSACRQAASEHLQDVLSGQQGVNQAFEAAAGGSGLSGRLR